MYSVEEMKLFNRELSLEQIIEIVRCNAEPEKDLIHTAALELANAVERLNDFDKSQSYIMLNELQKYKDTGLTPEEIMDGKMLTGWVPVSERLPGEKGEYLVSYHPCYWDRVDNKICTGIDSFRGKSTWSKNKYQRVIAWMPLPEAYKPGEPD